MLSVVGVIVTVIAVAVVVWLINKGERGADMSGPLQVGLAILTLFVALVPLLAGPVDRVRDGGSITPPPVAAGSTAPGSRTRHGLRSPQPVRRGVAEVMAGLLRERSMLRAGAGVALVGLLLVWFNPVGGPPDDSDGKVAGSVVTTSPTVAPTSALPAPATTTASVSPPASSENPTTTSSRPPMPRPDPPALPGEFQVSMVTPGHNEPVSGLVPVRVQISDVSRVGEVDLLVENHRCSDREGDGYKFEVKNGVNWEEGVYDFLFDSSTVPDGCLYFVVCPLDKNDPSFIHPGGDEGVYFRVVIDND